MEEVQAIVKAFSLLSGEADDRDAALRHRIKLHLSGSGSSSSSSSAAKPQHKDALLECRLCEAQSRLQSYNAPIITTDTNTTTNTTTTTDTATASVQHRTGQLILHLLLQLHNTLSRLQQSTSSLPAPAPPLSGPSRIKAQDDAPPPPTIAPLIGTRDSQCISLCLALCIHWHIAHLITSFDRAHHARTRAELREDEGEAELRIAAQNLQQAFQSLRHLLPPALVSPSNAIPSSGAAKRGIAEQAASTRSSEISAIVLESAVPALLAMAIRLGWLPHLAGGDQLGDAQSAAATLQSVLRGLSTASSINALSSSSALAGAAAASATPTQRSSAPTAPLMLTQRAAPAYVRHITMRFMAAQLLRQDGVRCMVAAALGFQDDHLGSASRDGGNAQLEGFEKIAQLLSSPPKGMPLQIFLGCIIPQMLQMLSDLPSAPLQHRASSGAPPQEDTTSGLLHPPSLQPRIEVPDSHARAIAFALCALHRRHQSEFSSVLEGYIWLPFQPSRTAAPPTLRSQSTTAVPDAKGELVVHSLHVSCAVRLIEAIISSAPPEPTFISSLLQPVFTQLFTCWSCLHGPGNMVDEVAADVGMKVILANLLSTYLKLGDASALASLLGANPDGLLIRARDGLGEEALDGDAFHWANAADGLEIRSGASPRQDTQLGTPLGDALSALSLEAWDVFGRAGLNDADETEVDARQEATNAQQLLAKLGLNLRPDPSLYVKMIQDSGRADVAALLLRHLLETYAGVQAAQEAGAEQLAAKVSPLLLLQCITQLLQAFQEQLLKAEPDVVLGFIDFALRSTNIAEASPKESNLQAPLIVPLPVDGSHSQLPDSALDDEIEAAADGSGSMGMSTELVCVALELLLALLEGHPNMTPSSHTLLEGIARSADHHAAGDVKVAKLAREVQLVLLARRHSARGPTAGKRASETSSPVRRGNALYNKALRLLQDPVVPVRAHGLTVLGDLVREADGVRMEAALVPALLDMLIQIVQDEESFLYLNAIRVLAALARRRDSDSRTLGRLVDVYIGAISARSLSMHASELDKRLRVGEALLLVIKQSEIQATELIAPLLSALASAYVPATLRSSVISVLGTTVEANPLRIAANGHAEQMALAMFDLIALELQGAKPSAEVDEKEEKGGVRMEDASKPAQLRRSAFHLLALLIRGSKHQIEALQQDRGPAESLSSLRLPNGSNLPSISANVHAHRAIQEVEPLLFDPAKAQMVERARTLSSYAQAVDVDAVVQIQAGELLADLQALQVVYLQSNR